MYDFPLRGKIYLKPFFASRDVMGGLSNLQGHFGGSKKNFPGHFHSAEVLQLQQPQIRPDVITSRDATSSCGAKWLFS